MTSDAQREIFEAWAKDFWGERYSGCIDYMRDFDGSYCDPAIHWQYKAWQAALASLPRMSEEEIAALLSESVSQHLAKSLMRRVPGLTYPEALKTYTDAKMLVMSYAARALIARLPHLVKE